MKILVKTPLNCYTGYGNDGLGLVTALVNAGFDVYLDPASAAPPLPKVICDLLGKRLVAPFDLIIHHIDPSQLGLTKEARRASKLTIAWTMWEFSSFDNMKGRSKLRKSLSSYDLVIGYDRVSAGALKQYVSPSKVAILQGGFWPELWPRVSRDWNSDRFGFCMVGQLHERKDPFVAIQAFKELKDERGADFEGAECHLKTNVPGLHMALEQYVPKLRVHYSVWPDHILREFYASQHVLLAPSRGEGKNMPALEFMSTGGTVIATNWGGHEQWLSSQYAYPLDYKLAPLDQGHLNCQNARAEKEHLKQLMWHAYTNRAEVAQKGELASQIIPQMCSWDAVVRRLADKLKELVPGGDRFVHHMNMAAQAQAMSRGGQVYDYA